MQWELRALFAKLRKVRSKARLGRVVLSAHSALVCTKPS